MATTKEGIYYPNDYNAAADVPGDMKKLAESVDEKVADLKKQNTSCSDSIKDIQDEQAIQNENIKKLTEDEQTNSKKIADIKAEQVTQNADIEELKAENERLKEDLNNSTISGHNEGENITIEGSAEARFKKLVVKGNSLQETRDGKNYFDASKIKNKNIVVSDNGKTITIPLANSGVGYTTTDTRLKELCPELKVGDVVILSFNRNIGYSYNNHIYLSGNTNETWVRNNEKTITQEMLDDIVIMYGNRYDSGETTQVILTDFSIMKSTEADITWEPYGAMPSPDFPSEIRNCGDNVNLFDENTATIEIGNITATGNFVSATDRVRVYSIAINPKTQYTVSSSNSDLQVVPCFYDDKDIFVSYNNGWKNMPYSFTTPENAKILKLIFKNLDKTITVDDITKLKLEKGSKATPYSPYGCGNVNFEIQNKNYWNNELVKTEGTMEKLETGFKITKNGTKRTGQVIPAYIPAGTYKLLCNVVSNNTTDKSKYIINYNDNTLKYINYNAKSVTFDKDVVSIQPYIDSGEPDETYYEVTNFMIVKDTEKDESYQPHQEQVYSFPTKPGQVFHKGDYLADDGTHQVKNTVEFDGSEGWYQFGNNVALVSEAIAKSSEHLNTDLQGFLCNIAKEGVASRTENNNTFATHNDIKTNTHWIVFNINTTVQEWKQYLAQQKADGTPVKIEYKLAEAEEIIEPYSPEQQKVWNEINAAKTYKGTTHIFCTDEISCEFEEEHIVDLEAYINSKIGATSADTPIQEQPATQEGPNMEEPSINLETEKSEEVGGEE